jgi:hypothetical protein
LPEKRIFKDMRILLKKKFQKSDFNYNRLSILNTCLRDSNSSSSIEIGSYLTEKRIFKDFRILLNTKFEKSDFVNNRLSILSSLFAEIEQLKSHRYQVIFDGEMNFQRLSDFFDLNNKLNKLLI